MEQCLAEITLDKKKRLALGKVLGANRVTSFEVYETPEGYLLKPKVSISAHELWVFENLQAKQSLAKGLSQDAKHDLGSFAKDAKD
ncbi:MAG TPA: hypothetical protein VFX30_01590 [bacterium]|nr:hypothetical protein [bacterium]